MNKTTMKDLRVQAEELAEAGVNNRAQLEAALPVMMKLKEMSDSAKQSVAAAIKVTSVLGELCTRYAVNHEKIFDNGKLVLSQQGVRTGDVTIGEEVFHLACGYDGYERAAAGEKLTRDFLLTLPEEWRKEKLEISVSGINQAAPSAEELAEHGLREKAKNVWSRVEAVA